MPQPKPPGKPGPLTMAIAMLLTPIIYGGALAAAVGAFWLIGKLTDSNFVFMALGATINSAHGQQKAPA